MKQIFQHPWMVAILTLMTFSSAFFIEYIKDKLNSESLMIGSLFVISIIIFSMIIFSLFSRIQIVEDYKERYAILEAFIKAQGLGGMISEESVSNIEKVAKSIWVFTADMANDIGVKNINIQDNKIIDIVKKNLEDGKTYVYFVPKVSKIYGALEKFKDIHKFKTGQVKICFIPEDEFHFISEIVIYDVENSTPNKAIQWFPHSEMNYFIKLDENHTMYISGVGKKLQLKYALVDL